MHQKTPLLVLVVGPTASGKTTLSIALAQALGTEILSFDSRQFYRELAIGSALPSESELAQVKHHFVADRSFRAHLNAGAYELEANQLLEKLFTTQQIVVAVGGSGLFAQALVAGFDEMSLRNPDRRSFWQSKFESEGLGPLQASLTARDPLYAAQVDIQNHQRLIRALEVIDSTGLPYSNFRKKTAKQRPYRTLWIGVDIDREVLKNRIDQRVLQMMDNGLLNEAKSLLPFKAHDALNTVGYRELFGYFEKQHDFDESVRLIQRNTRHFARRQLTWFRKNSAIHWFNANQIDEMLTLIRSFEEA